MEDRSEPVSWFPPWFLVRKLLECGGCSPPVVSAVKCNGTQAPGRVRGTALDHVEPPSKGGQDLPDQHQRAALSPSRASFPVTRSPTWCLSGTPGLFTRSLPIRKVLPRGRPGPAALNRRSVAQTFPSLTALRRNHNEYADYSLPALPGVFC